MEKFSVLMSVYKNEKAEYLEEALKSIYEKQTLKPNEIVLVEDGPLTEKLYKVISKYNIKYKEVLKTIPLEKNMGLGNALNIGLDNCSNELIARMDTDDIAYSNRFEKQIEVFFKNPKIAVVGSWMDEFIGDTSNIVSQKKVPELHNQIKQYIKVRNPINHPSVMYRKSSVIRAGSYQEFYLNEDYYLWGRMFINGSIFYNIQESLLGFRTSGEMIKRRGGLKYAKQDILLQTSFRKLNLISSFEMVKNIIIRVPVRLLPNTLRKKIYVKIRRI